MILTFAGSTHTKYMNYLLEMLCDLELESSPELRDAFLANWIINPSGEAGTFIAGDKFQEQLQDEMYEHIGRKDRGFDEDYMRKVIAPNAYRFVLVKKTVMEGLGLTRRGYKHSEPHTNPEITKLLHVYQSHQLHLFRKGRTYGGNQRRTDNLGQGIQQLMEGELASWIHDTTRVRHLSRTQPRMAGLDEADIEADITQLDQQIAIEQASEGDEMRSGGHILQLDNGELVFEFDDADEGLDGEAEGLDEIGINDIEIPIDNE